MIKTAFSTLGCPQWSFAEIFSTATDLGFDGIEFRGVESEIYMPRVREFSPENIEATRQKFKAAGIAVPVFSSGAVMGDSENAQAAVKEALDYIDLCSGFGSPYVRVLADRAPAPSCGVDEDDLVDNLRQATSYAASKGVGVLIETNGCYCHTDRLVALIEKVGAGNLAVVWDIHHTCRYGGEAPSVTVKRLGSLIRHVHVKDSVIEDGKLSYRLLGEGDLPVGEAVAELKKIGFDGFLCLEWVKRWALDLTEPGIAFPHFIYKIREIMK